MIEVFLKSILLKITALQRVWPDCFDKQQCDDFNDYHLDIAAA
jgi:hypothetical protein